MEDEFSTLTPGVLTGKKSGRIDFICSNQQMHLVEYTGRLKVCFYNTLIQSEFQGFAKHIGAFQVADITRGQDFLVLFVSPAKHSDT